jgi:hypothetical protein
MSARYTGGLVYNAPGGWSGLFDGSGDTVSAASNTSLIFGTGDFTVECWINSANQPGSYNTFIGGDTTGSFLFSLTGSGTSTALYINAYGSAGIYNQSITFTQGTWFHIAATRSGTSLRIFVNGIQLGATVTDSTNFSAATRIVGGAGTANQNFNGYISNVRIVKGNAVYTSNFIPPVGALLPITNTSLLICAYPTFRDGSSNNFTITATGNALVATLNPFPTSQLPNPALGGAGNGVYTMSQYAALKAANLWPAFDPFYRNVTLMLHGDGTNAAQNNTFLDSSTNNFTITRNGNTTQGTFTPYGSNWSMYQSDASSSYLGFTTSVGTSFQFAGDFTIEGWVYYNSSSGDASLYVISDNTNYLALNISMSAGNYNIYLNSGSPTSSFSHGISVGVWTHVAMVRSGSTVTLYTNGVSKGTITNSSTLGYSAPAINRTGGGVSGIDRYISNIRVVKSAVYTSAFTPSTTPLTAITNTSLLTCQSNRFVDNSSNAYTPTITGTPSVQRFSPFSPTPDYSTAVFGGGANFDGTGDSLTLANNAAFNIGANDFCMEMWAYGPSGMFFWAAHQGGVANGFYFETGGGLSVFPGYNSLIPFPSWTNGQWIHAVCTRASGRFRLFQNGVLVATTTTNPNVNMDGHLLGISGGDNFVGGVGQFGGGRYINGSVPTTYQTASTTLNTQIFTPPTSPFTTTSQGATSADVKVVVNFTNAAIIDNAMMNNLETVGNAQISTSVKKYGTGSMYFDGTGDSVKLTSNLSVIFGTGDFTIEGWIYLNTVAPIYQGFLDTRVNGGSTGCPVVIMSGANICYYTNVGFQITGSALSISTWYHIAVTRSATSTKLFVNGTQSGSTYTDSNNYTSSTNPVVGALFDGYSLNGYIDDLRITKGVARYTGNFTPPTSQVQDQ